MLECNQVKSLFTIWPSGLGSTAAAEPREPGRPAEPEGVLRAFSVDAGYSRSQLLLVAVYNSIKLLMSMMVGPNP